MGSDRGRHEASWAASGEREMDAQPYAGRHEALAAIDWSEPGPERCPSCGHLYEPGQQHCCGIQRHYDDKTGGPDDV